MGLIVISLIAGRKQHNFSWGSLCLETAWSRPHSLQPQLSSSEIPIHFSEFVWGKKLVGLFPRASGTICRLLMLSEQHNTSSSIRKSQWLLLAAVLWFIPNKLIVFLGMAVSLEEFFFLFFLLFFYLIKDHLMVLFTSRRSPAPRINAVRHS